jgi:hypothetical protein
LFSIYGVPPTTNIFLAKKNKEKKRKKRDPSIILQGQQPITLPENSTALRAAPVINVPHD